MSGPDRLDAAEHETILRDQILTRPNVVEATPQAAPRAIILGGQPGAGKGNLVDLALDELHSNAVVVDPDALREYHPNVDAFRRENPYKWSGRTHADASQWADELRDAVVESRRNLVFDTTLSNGEWTSGLIRDLQAKGYTVEVRAIATPKLESELGVDARFTGSVDARGHGRHVPPGARETIYEKLPGSLDLVRAETTAPVRIFDREGVELYNSTVDIGRPSEALESARQARINRPEVARRVSEGWERQVDWHRDLPERLAANPRIDSHAAKAMLDERQAIGVEMDVQRNARAASTHLEMVENIPALDARHAVAAAEHEAFATRAAPRLRAGTALGFAGTALMLYDAGQTGFAIHQDLGEGNAASAKSKAIHFGGRTVGGFAGAGLGMAAGAAMGIETGPGALVTGAVGGIAGAVAGDKIAEWTDNRAIYTQTDRLGHQWTLDPQRQDRGWRRTAPVDGTHDGVDNAHREPLRASPLLENELNFQATRTSAELILGAPPVPRDPFAQPANPSDPASITPADWVRDPRSHTWQRTATVAFVERGLSPTRVDTASPERAAELDHAAAQTVLENARNAPPVIAARFEEAYARNGWAAYGPMPDAVRNARANTDALVASDGDRYARQPDGQWVSHGVIYNSTANGNVREELEATRTVLAARLPPPLAIGAPAPLSAEDRLRDTVVGAYRNAGIELTPQQLDTRAQAVGETWRAHGLSPETTALRVAPVGNRVGLDSPIESLRLDADGKTYRLDATTAVEQPRERHAPEEAKRVQGAPSLPAGFAPVRQRPKDIRDEDHPGHRAYRHSLDQVHRMEGRLGIAPGAHSERLAATVAVAVERERLTVHRLDMGKDGQVIAVERGAAPDFVERKLSIHTRDAMSRDIEATSQEWLVARSPHYRADQPTVERTLDQSRALATLSPPDQAMFARIRGELPASISDDVVGQAMLEAKREGISKASGIYQTVVAGDRVFVAGIIPGQLAMTDVSGPTQTLAQNVEHIQSANQHQRHAEVEQHKEQQRAQGPAHARVLS